MALLPAQTTMTPPCAGNTCGNVNISYPFYLRNETAVLLGYNSSYCGYPGLGILCKDGNQAILQLGSGNYTVSTIDYRDLTVTVVDQEVLEETGTCPRVENNVTFPQASWLSVGESGTRGLRIPRPGQQSATWRPPAGVISAR
ncbi:uncharacterized protein LOC133908523 [Phragmites australis]|uniref:uncharacterized protein LOC133908523 n=1 Tax=Phragmites australis TaxID=29695 RepID=UPI002D766C7E|nr:uncharacterized protein LOC133908523 [Phragmites australis]